MLILGYDPGGANANGVALIYVADDGSIEAWLHTCDCVGQAWTGFKLGWNGTGSTRSTQQVSTHICHGLRGQADGVRWIITSETGKRQLTRAFFLAIPPEGDGCAGHGNGNEVKRDLA